MPLADWPMEIATAPAPAMILDVSRARTSAAPGTVITLFLTVAVVSTSTMLTEPEPAPEPAMPLPVVPEAIVPEPATVKALISPVDSARTVKPPVPLSFQAYSVPSLTPPAVTRSTVADVVVVRRLTAIATPAATDVEPPEFDRAIASDTPPATVITLEPSVARTRTSLAVASLAKPSRENVTVESASRARVAPVTVLRATEPAIDTAIELPTPGDVPPPDVAPARPAATATIRVALSAVTESRLSLGELTSLVVAVLLRSEIAASRTKASVVVETSFQENAPARPTADLDASLWASTRRRWP